MSEYFYPDKGDALTIDLIKSVSAGSYWEESENEALKFASGYLSALSRDCAVLDLGCGRGRLLSFLSEFSDNVFGLEPDQDRYAAAKETADRLNKSGRAAFTVENDDINGLERILRGGRLDAVLCSHVIQHITSGSAEEMLRRLSAFCREGALLVLAATWNGGKRSRFTREFFDSGKRVSESCSAAEFEAAAGLEGILPVAFYTENRIRNTAGKFGFDFEDKFCFHFSFKDREAAVYDDIEMNKAGSCENARDVMYIFRKR